MDRYPQIDHELFGFAFHLMNKAANGQVPSDIRMPYTETPDNAAYSLYVVANEMQWCLDAQHAFEVRAQALLDVLDAIGEEDSDIFFDQSQEALYAALIKSASISPLLPSGGFALKTFLDSVRARLEVNSNECLVSLHPGRRAAS